MNKVRFISTFIALTLFFPAKAQLVITEIMYNPPESGTDSLEYIEFFNADTATIDLTGYSFSQGISHTFSSGLIQPAQYFVIAIDSNAHFNVFGQMPDAEWSSGALSNSGEDIVLIDSSGLVIDSVDYDDASPWPSGSGAGEPDGGGPSIELLATTLDNNLGSNWVASNNSTTITINGNIVRGSPGFPNFNVSIQESKVETNFTIYPNPNPGEFRISTRNTMAWERVQVYTIDGKKVFDQKINTQEVIKLNSLKTGIYYLQIENSTQKLMIKP